MTSRRIENEKKGGGAGFCSQRRQNTAAKKTRQYTWVKFAVPRDFFAPPALRGRGAAPLGYEFSAGQS